MKKNITIYAREDFLNDDLTNIAVSKTESSFSLIRKILKGNMERVKRINIPKGTIKYIIHDATSYNYNDRVMSIFFENRDAIYFHLKSIYAFNAI